MDRKSQDGPESAVLVLEGQMRMLFLKNMKKCNRILMVLEPVALGLVFSMIEIGRIKRRSLFFQQKMKSG